MGLSQLEICNHALLKLGTKPIDTLVEPAPAVNGTKTTIELCNIFFDQAYEEVLRIYPWNSATKRTELTLSEYTEFGYDNYVEKPDDMIRLINCFRNKDQSDQRTAWVLEGDYILSNEGKLYIRYIYKPTVSDLEPLATDALITNLAKKLAPALQLDADWATKLNNELYEQILPQARSIDTFENKELLLEDSSWLLSRNSEHPYV